jgi:hypothetical protein
MHTNPPTPIIKNRKINQKIKKKLNMKKNGGLGKEVVSGGGGAGIVCLPEKLISASDSVQHLRGPRILRIPENQEGSL